MRMSRIVKRCPNDDDDDDIRWIDFVVRNEIFVRPAATAAAAAAAAVIERLRFGSCSTCTLLIHHHEIV